MKQCHFDFVIPFLGGVGMKHIENDHYQYIMSKYATERFQRCDGIFAVDSGMAPEELLMGIARNDGQYASAPHVIRKAEAFAYVLKNTRISCDKRDIFPAINMIDRPLEKTLISAWRHEVFAELIPEVEARRARLEHAGAVTIWPDYDHSVPVWDRLFSLGFPGILSESERAREDRAWDAESVAFFEGIRITYEAILSFLDRLYDIAETEKMKKALRSLRRGAPQSFYEALLLSYLYFMLSEHIDSLQVRSLSNFDRLFYGFYKKDLSNGVSKDEIKSDLAHYFLQFTALNNYWNQPVFLGGEHADGTTVINELSYLFLDVYDDMGIYNPKIQIKVSDTTPKDFVEKALDMIRRGHNSIVFVSDQTIRAALMRAGVDAEAARLCNITGCYEYLPQSSYATAMNYMNLLKPLEYALHGGCDGVTGNFAGLRSPVLASFESFDALLMEYKRQLRYAVDAAIETVNGFEAYLTQINPLSLLSATFDSCLLKGRDAIAGGGYQNDTQLMCGFLADVADSLAMIQKYVYEKRELTLEAFVEMLDANYEGNEIFRRRLLSDREKYGNNNDRPDAIALAIVNTLTEAVCGRENSRAGKWSIGFHVARMSYTQGKQTGASANGRRLGEELSKNISASMGQNREGATAAILSATKIDASAFVSDAALDLGLLPSSVSGKDGLAAMYGILLTFLRRGGHAMHMNVFDAAMLRDAQAHPEKYEDLQIRVCGWNVLWNNIAREEQNGFILQAEALG